MVSMAMYGGALIAASAGAGVAVERALGWSRQLRLTPLHPTAYILVKAFVALVMGAVAILAVNVIGAVQGKPQMPFDVWVKCGLLTLACVMTFAALGVFVGYLVPGENVMQVLGPGLALLAFLGGLFIPLSSYSPVVRDIAYWTPMYGVAEVARAPADPGAALVRRRQRGRLAGHLRARRRVADEQGHRAGLTASVTSMTSGSPIPSTPVARRWGVGFAAIWLFFLLDPLRRGVEHPRHGRRCRRRRGDASSSAPST